MTSSEPFDFQGKHVTVVRKIAAEKKGEVVVICGELEAQISQLPPAERRSRLICGGTPLYQDGESRGGEWIRAIAMTIRFAAPPHALAPRVSPRDIGKVCGMPANDNGGNTALLTGNIEPGARAKLGAAGIEVLATELYGDPSLGREGRLGFGSGSSGSKHRAVARMPRGGNEQRIGGHRPGAEHSGCQNRPPGGAPGGGRRRDRQAGRRRADDGPRAR